MSYEDQEICVVGMGPRGLVVLERLLANFGGGAAGAAGAGSGAAAGAAGAAGVFGPGAGRRLTVHVVDPYPRGAGQVWRSEQSGELLMNTIASQVTVFPDESVDLAGRLRQGPSLYEWARNVVLFGSLEGYEAGVAAEIEALGPDTYASRRLVGYYLTWAFRRIVDTAPAGVTVLEHATSAVALWDEPDGRQSVQLETGVRLRGLDGVVMALGHYPVTPTRGEQGLAAFAIENQLTYILPTNPADVDLSNIKPGEPTVLRGLGLCFFDYVALLTTGRGGRFEEGPDGLVYRASGLEPLLYAGSSRGVPHQTRGLNQKGASGRHDPRVLTVETVRRLREEHPGGLDFRADLWPLIAKEVETVYYTALLRSGDCACVADEFSALYLPIAWGDEEEILVRERFGIGADQVWDWAQTTRPLEGRSFESTAEFGDWVDAYLAADAREALLGNVSGPVKAAMDSLRDLRNEVRLAIDHGGLTGESYRRDVDGWYSSMNAFLSIGPPSQRADQLLALVRAGVLELVGPDMALSTSSAADGREPGFVVESPHVRGSRRTATAMVEARLHVTDVTRTADPLLRWLLADGSCTRHRLPNPDGSAYETGGIAITGRPFHPIGASGAAHPRRFFFGVPTEGAHWATAAGARPGVNSVMLSDADAISLGLLRIGDPEDTVWREPSAVAGS